MKKLLAHGMAVFACGVLSTLLVAWSVAGCHPFSRLRNELILLRCDTGVRIVYEKVMAGDKGWAGGMAADRDTNPPTGYYSAQTDEGWSGITGCIYRFPLTTPVADALLARGATRGLVRSESANGLPPASLVRRTTSIGRPEEIAMTLYWGCGLPLIKCDFVYSQAGARLSTSGLAGLDDGRFLPFAPVWPGFGLSVLLLGAVAWSIAFGGCSFMAGIVCRKFMALRDRCRPPLPPTVACPGCGYPRKGLASIDPCPECGHAGPRPI